MGRVSVGVERQALVAVDQLVGRIIGIEILTFLTASSYPLNTLSTNSRPKVRCNELNLSSFGLSSFPLPQSEKPPEVPAVRIQRSEKRLKASMAEAETLSSVGGSDGRTSGMVGVDTSEEIRSKTTMTAWRNVAAAVEETTETRESCSLKHSSRALVSAQHDKDDD